jgi:hypothetical protein
LTSVEEKAARTPAERRMLRKKLQTLGAKLLSIKALQLVVLVAAGSFAIFELTLTRYDRRVDASLAFAERFTEGAIAEQRRLLDRAWYAHAEDVAALQQLGGSGGAATLELFQAFFRREILQGAEAADEIDLKLAIAEIADTLDQVALCVNPPGCSGLGCSFLARCDETTARQHFCGYSSSFTNLYAPVLEEIQEDLGTAELGVAARDFATSTECQE